MTDKKVLTLKRFTFVAKGTVSLGNIDAKFNGTITTTRDGVMADEVSVAHAIMTVRKSHPDFVPTKVSVSQRLKRPNGSSVKDTFVVVFNEESVRFYDGVIAKALSSPTV